MPSLMGLTRGSPVQLAKTYTASVKKNSLEKRDFMVLKLEIKLNSLLFYKVSIYSTLCNNNAKAI